MPEFRHLCEQFGVGRLVMVGDRGMICCKAINETHKSEGIAWITDLKSASICAPVDQGQLQLDQPWATAFVAPTSFSRAIASEIPAGP